VETVAEAAGIVAEISTELEATHNADDFPSSSLWACSDTAGPLFLPPVLVSARLGWAGCTFPSSRAGNPVYPGERKEAQLVRVFPRFEVWLISHGFARPESPGSRTCACDHLVNSVNYDLARKMQLGTLQT
jgi:hypothetical protein